MKIAIPALLAVLAVPSTLRAQDPPPELEALVVVPRFTVFSAGVRGKVDADEASFPAPILEGSSVRFDSDLDLDDSDPAWIAEIAAFRRAGERYSEFGSVSWLEASYEGSTTLGDTETFNGRTFLAGTAVRSKLKYRSYGADVTAYDPEPASMEPSSLALTLGVRYTSLRVQVEGGGQETDERIQLLYGGGGFRGEARWGEGFTGIFKASVYFSFGGYEDWWNSEYEEWGGVIVEGHVGLAGTFGPIHLEGGWRYVSNSSYAQVDTPEKFEDNDFMIELSGPYFSATLRF